MPEELKDNVIEKREQVDVLDAKGNTINREASPLAGIFDKIEAGKEEGKSAAQVISEKPAPVERKVEDKKIEEKKVEPTDLDKKLEQTQALKDEKKETERSALFKATEPVKIEEKVVDKKVETQKVEEEAPEEELKVLPHDKPKTARRIQTLLKQIDAARAETTKTKTEVTEKATKLAELEKKLGEVKTVDPKTDENVKKQLDELAMFRRRYDLDKDPEVKTKFDSRVDSAEKSILDILSRRGAGEPMIELIKSEGGWNKFAESGRMISLKDGKQVTAAELADTIVSQLPLSERRAIDAAMIEQTQTKRDKERFFNEEQAKANDFFKKQEDAVQKQRQEQDTQVQAMASTIEKWHKDTVDKTDWLKEREVPANATAEQKAAIVEDNKYTKQLNGLLIKTLNARTVEESLEIALDSVKFYQERREKSRLLTENATLKSQLTAKQAELDKFKGASTTVRKTGSIATGAASETNKIDDKPKSLEAAFDKIANSKGDNNE